MARSGRRYYGRSRGRYFGKYNKGQEAARRHIEEARAFSHEIGGTDTDVKQYFFSLGGQHLDGILKEYGKKYGNQVEEYARETLPRWRTEKTQMSGKVAKRLFEFLPPRMPNDKKYELAENVWKHFGPSSSHSYRVGPTAKVSDVASVVAETLDEVVLKFAIPEPIQNRFNWLAAGDVRLKEKLLNHFRQKEKELAVQKLNAEIPLLQRQMHYHGSITRRAKSVIQVHKHDISIWVEKRLGSEIREGAPAFHISGGAKWFWWIVGAAILFYLLSR